MQGYLEKGDYVIFGVNKIPTVFWNDPLYQNVLTATNFDEYSRAKEALLSIRGNDAIKTLRYAIERTTGNLK